MLAQAQDALDAAAQAERLGLIGVLAVAVIGFGFVAWFLFKKALADRDIQITRLLEERAQVIEDNERLRSMYDRVIVLAASASKQAAEEVRRLTDGRS